MSEIQKTADLIWEAYLEVDRKMKIRGKTPKLVAEEARLWSLFREYELKLAGGK